MHGKGLRNRVKLIITTYPYDLNGGGVRNEQPFCLYEYKLYVRAYNIIIPPCSNLVPTSGSSTNTTSPSFS
jgi:hypothetical protein